jgi:NADH-quinone oxidoreductase subunit M
MLWAYQRAFHGEPDEENRSFPEMVSSEKLVILPLIGLMVFIGVYPKPMLERIQPSVERLIAHVEASTGDFREPVTQAGAELDPARIEERMREAEGDHTTGPEGAPAGAGETTDAGAGREEGGR